MIYDSPLWQRTTYAYTEAREILCSQMSNQRFDTIVTARASIWSNSQFAYW